VRKGSSSAPPPPSDAPQELGEGGKGGKGGKGAGGKGGGKGAKRKKSIKWAGKGEEGGVDGVDGQLQLSKEEEETAKEEKRQLRQERNEREAKAKQEARAEKEMEEEAKREPAEENDRDHEQKEKDGADTEGGGSKERGGKGQKKGKSNHLNSYFYEHQMAMGSISSKLSTLVSARTSLCYLVLSTIVSSCAALLRCCTAAAFCRRILSSYAFLPSTGESLPPERIQLRSSRWGWDEVIRQWAAADPRLSPLPEVSHTYHNCYAHKHPAPVQLLTKATSLTKTHQQNKPHTRRGS
jgi:hypothetical protein